MVWMGMFEKNPSLRERETGTPVKVYFYTANVDKINNSAKYFSDFLC